MEAVTQPLDQPSSDDQLMQMLIELGIWKESERIADLTVAARVIDRLQRAGANCTCAPISKDVDAALASDRRLYGSCFVRIDADGTRTRLDPSTVTIRRQRSERCPHGVHPLNRCKDCD